MIAMRFRYRLPEKAGRWYATERDAMMAAVRAGLGSVEDYVPAPHEYPPTIYLHPLVTIEAQPAP